MERGKGKKRGVIIITIIFSMHMCSVCIRVHMCVNAHEYVHVCIFMYICVAVLACAPRCQRLNDIGRLPILPSKLLAETGTLN